MMKPLLSLLLALLISCNSPGQEKSFTALAEEVNAIDGYYNQVPTFYTQMAALKDFNLSYEAVRAELHEETLYSAGKDSVEVGALREYYQAKLFSKLDELFAHKDFSKHDIVKLLSLQIIKSDDNKLFTISIDENTGGSYRSRLSAVYYIPNKPAERRINNFFDTDGYSTIYTLNTPQGSKYLLLGQVVGCNSCYVEYALLMHFENGKPSEDFKYRTEIRGWDETIVYDPDTEFLTINYMTSDLSPHCNCTDIENEGTDELTDWECSCTFVFNGKTFELAKNESRKIRH